ncbi:15905_t:CDS:1 [Funneliformis geosporum]|uniref:865_t:CDS:1 n=1 Tax=Funneliformis geosporum TaxID=1117311 RepID=A0A9W4SP54_9GLOM|nr:15905_t:CDS:1 [Funneliformis geosporum]CAI2176500.1 865_t:CDS:1 [Funneliformis geosporum]
MKFPPEILQNIFKEISYFTDLYNCLLVNRYWCTNVLPTLWENPFEKIFWSRNFKIIEIYISCLSPQSKLILQQNGLDRVQLLKEGDKNIPLFNYIMYLRGIDFTILYTATANWIYKIIIEQEKRDRELQQRQQLEKILVEEDSTIENISKISKKYEYLSNTQLIIFQELIKMIVKKSSVQRYKLTIPEGLGSYTYLDCLNEIIPERSHLELLKLTTSNHHLFFSKFKNIFCTIDKLIIKCKEDDDNLSDFLNSLPRIHFLKIRLIDQPMPHLTNALRNLLKVNDDKLTYLWIKQGGSIPLDIFSGCKNLVNLRITDSHLPDARNTTKSFWSLNTLQPFSNGPEYNRLVEFSLSIDARINLHQLSKIISKTNGSLQYLCLKWEIEQDPEHCQLLFDNILKSCPNLIDIFISISPHTIKYLIDFLENLKHLEILEIDSLVKNIDLNDWLPNIGRKVTSRLTLLGFYCKFICNLDEFNQFLNNIPSVSLFDEQFFSVGLELYFHDANVWMGRDKINLLRRYVKIGKIHSNVCGP